MIDFVWTLFGNTNVGSLLVAELREFSSHRVEVQPCHFLIEMFGQHVNAERVLVPLSEHFNLSENLVRKGGAHHEAGMTRRVSKVHQTSFAEHQDGAPIGEMPLVNLGLYFDPGRAGQGFQACHVNFVVKVPHVGNNCLVLETEEVVKGDDVKVSCRANQDIDDAEY